MSLNIGDIAPDFSLPANGNQSISLKDLRGKKVVLFIYPKDDTSGCTKEAIAFSEHSQAFTEHNVKILGLSKDSVKSHEKFIKKHALSVDLLSDEDCKTLDDYGVWVEKSMYGKKYMGAERTTFIIDTKGKIEYIFSKVKVKDHVEAVLKKIKELSE